METFFTYHALIILSPLAALTKYESRPTTSSNIKTSDACPTNVLSTSFVSIFHSFIEQLAVTSFSPQESARIHLSRSFPAFHLLQKNTIDHEDANREWSEQGMIKYSTIVIYDLGIIQLGLPTTDLEKKNLF